MPGLLGSKELSAISNIKLDISDLLNFSDPV